jgi:hypothetical protein
VNLSSGVAASTRHGTPDHTLDHTLDDRLARSADVGLSDLEPVTNRRLLLSPLWLIVALVTFVAGGTASAAANSGPETRVRANSTVIETSVGHPSSERPASVGCLRQVQPESVVGACVATEAVVIGEDMRGRVIPAASGLGAGYYDPPTAPSSEWMENNRRWINDRMDEGCVFYDCGPAPGRSNYPSATSEFYQMELNEIAKRGYPVKKVPC